MKTYKFYEDKNGLDTPTILIVKESDLTDSQIQLMLGTFMNDFEKLPSIVQGRFASFVINKALSNSNYEIIPKS